MTPGQAIRSAVSLLSVGVEASFQAVGVSIPESPAAGGIAPGDNGSGNGQILGAN
jgi:hypothetical protein